VSAIALDPLIAEAKRRALRRRLLLATLVLVAASAVAATLVVESRGGLGAGGQSASPALVQAPVLSFGRTEFKRGGRVIWVEGPHHAIWLTSNGARTWRRTVVPGLTWGAWLGNFDFVDPTHGWAVVESNQHEEVAHTTDGGRSWRASYLPVHESSLGVHFQTRLRGYVDAFVAHGPHLRDVRFASTDGGETWTRGGVAHPSTLLRRRYAVRAYVPGDTTEGDQIGALERTNDYGRHWTPVQLPGNPDIKELKMSGPRLVAVALLLHGRGVRFAIYASDDDGRHWAQHLAPRKIQPGGPQDACCFYAYAPAVGTVYSLSAVSTKLFVTHDGGKTWHGFQPSGLFPLNPLGGPVDWVTARVGLAIRGRTLVRTTDGGHHWKPAGPLEPRKAHKRG
jgi:photosystem II stability/assembly factor-like uncharacterized protein